MEKKEFDAMVESMKHSGLTEDNIMDVLIESFMQKKCDQKDLEIMVDWLGYRLSDQFFEDQNLKRMLKWTERLNI